MIRTSRADLVLQHTEQEKERGGFSRISLGILSFVCALALVFTSVPSFAFAVSGSSDETEYTTTDGAKYWAPTTWSAGEQITVRGEGWKNSAGNAGSTIAIKLDAGGTTPATPATDFDETVWAVVTADASGAWEATISFPTLDNASEAWAAGETHSITFLTGSLQSGDRARSYTVDFTIAESEPGWIATVRSYDTNVVNGYQLTFDADNRKVYYTDASWSTASRTVTETADGYSYSDETFTAGNGKLVEFDAATETLVSEHSFLGLTRNDGSGAEGFPWDWSTQSETATSISSIRTTFSPYGVEVDGKTTDATGEVDATLITTTARAQISGYNYGGAVVAYSASQGAPTDADRIWAYEDGSPVFDGPRRIAVNTETHRAYITNLGQGRNGTTDGRAGYVTVIDTTKRGIDAVVAQIAVPNTADTNKAIGVIGLAVDEENNLIYVGTIGAGDGSIYVIDGDAIEESSSSTADHKQASFTANADAITSLDATAPLNARPTYDSELKRLYVASWAAEGTITAIDADPTSADYGTVIESIATGATNAVAVDGERGLLYSANLGDQEVVVYSTDTHEELLRVPTSGNALNIGIDPVTHDAWVSNFSDAGKTDVITVTEAIEHTGTEYTTTDGAKYYVEEDVVAGESIRISGTGWKNTAGTEGSIIAIKLDEGGVSTKLDVTHPVTGAVQANKTIYAIAQANAAGEWEIEIPFPTLENASVAWAAGETHSIRLLTGSLLTGDVTRTAAAEFDIVAAEGSEVVESIEGEDRYATAAAAALSAYPEGADGVIVATGENYPDALAVAGLAGMLDYPIVLSASGALSPATAEVVETLDPTKVIIVGGTAALSDAVENDLGYQVGSENLTRIGGSDRYTTAQAIYDYGTEVSAVDPGDDIEPWSTTAIVATGSNYPDALSISPYAAASVSPIFLASTNGLIEDTTDALAEDGFENALISGGTGVVSAAVEAGLVSELGEDNVVRLGGDDRYLTSALAASWLVDNAAMSFDGVGIATGKNYPDALAGSALLGSTNSVLLLADTGNIAALDLLETNSDSISHIRFLGGVAAVTPDVREAVLNGLGWTVE